MTAPSVSKPAAAAGGGVLAGLLTIFLPLFQVLPQHLSPSTVGTAVIGGVTLILGFLAHHGLTQWTGRAYRDVAPVVKDLEDLDPDAAAKLDALVEAPTVDPEAIKATVRSELTDFRNEITAATSGGVNSTLVKSLVRGVLAELHVVSETGIVQPEPVTPAAGEAAEAAGVDPSVVAQPTAAVTPQP